MNVFERDTTVQSSEIRPLITWHQVHVSSLSGDASYLLQKHQASKNHLPPPHQEGHGIGRNHGNCSPGGSGQAEQCHWRDQKGLGWTAFPYQERPCWLEGLKKATANRRNTQHQEWKHGCLGVPSHHSRVSMIGHQQLPNTNFFLR